MPNLEIIEPTNIGIRQSTINRKYFIIKAHITLCDSGTEPLSMESHTLINCYLNKYF